MQRKLVGILVTLGAVAALSGCGGGGEAGGSSDSIVGVLWQWNGSQETQPAGLSAVPDPENYLLLLNEDGSFEAKADCNQLAGTHSLSGGDLTLTLGPMTMAACPPESLSDLYVQQLGEVANQALNGGQLTLGLRDDAGAMFFNPA